jgi:hypothetical protein
MERIAKLCCIWRKFADSPEQLATEGLRGSGIGSEENSRAYSLFYHAESVGMD